MTDTTDTTETTTEDVSGLKAKNSQLTNKLKTSNNRVTELEDRLTELENARDDALDSTKSDADKAAQKLQRQIDQLTQKLSDSEKREAEHLIDGTIAAAIAKGGVLPDAVGLVTAYLKLGATVKDGAATVNGVPLDDHISTYFSSPEARVVLAAPANSGGGAQGSSAKASAWSKPPETAEEFDRWMKDSLSNPAMTNAQADTWGRPDLKTQA